MGADIKNLRTRIRSVNSTLHLTTAMGLVASSKIRRTSDAMEKARTYADAVAAPVRLLTAAPECRKSPYLQMRPGNRVRMILIAGDRGMAGGYNANIFRLAREYPDAEWIAIGKRACERYGGEYDSAEYFNDAEELARRLCADFADGAYDRLGVLHTVYRSVLKQEACADWILPLAPEPGTQGHGVLFEPDELTVLNTAIPAYVAGLLAAYVRESVACEVAARRLAMDNAGKNAQEMLEHLQISYNRARQGAITQEITEIVAGSGIG